MLKVAGPESLIQPLEEILPRRNSHMGLLWVREISFYWVKTLKFGRSPVTVVTIVLTDALMITLSFPKVIIYIECF